MEDIPNVNRRPRNDGLREARRVRTKRGGRRGAHPVFMS
jgi:hypothetical protein